MQMTLEVRVPNLELLAPKAEYSIYYPAYLEGVGTAPNPAHPLLSETQYVMK